MADTFENKINALKAQYEDQVRDKDELNKLVNEAKQIIKDFRENKAIKYGGPIAAGVGDVLLNLALIAVTWKTGPISFFSQEFQKNRKDEKEIMTIAKQKVFDELEKKVKALPKISKEKPKQATIRNVIPAAPAAGPFVGAGGGAHGLPGNQPANDGDGLGARAQPTNDGDGRGGAAGPYAGSNAGAHGLPGNQAANDGDGLGGQAQPTNDDLLAQLPESLLNKIKKTFDQVLPRS